MQCIITSDTCSHPSQPLLITATTPTAPESRGGYDVTQPTQ